MHIHGMQINSAASLYAGAAAEKAAQAERAAETRKRLLRASATGDGLGEDSFASLMGSAAAGQVEGSANGSQVEGVEKYPYNRGGRDPDLG